MTRPLDRALLQAALLANLAASNLIVNGFMQVSQENGASLVTGTGKYPVDQFITSTDNSGIQAQQVAAPFPSQPDIGVGIKLTAPAVFAQAANTATQVYQPIEGQNLTRLQYGAANARPVTMIFALYPSYTGIAGFSLVNTPNSGALRSWVKRLPIIANQLNFFCFTIPGDVVAALGATNTGALQVRWCFASGATYTTNTTDGWVAGNYVATPDITNIAAVAGQNVILSGCLMIPGRFKVTQDQWPLLQRRYDVELDLCRRYFMKWSNGGACYIPEFGRGTYSQLNLPFPRQMRVVPSMVYDIGNPTGGATGSYGAVSASADGWNLRGDTTGNGTYSQITYYIATARM